MAVRIMSSLHRHRLHLLLSVGIRGEVTRRATRALLMFLQRQNIAPAVMLGMTIGHATRARVLGMRQRTTAPAPAATSSIPIALKTMAVAAVAVTPGTMIHPARTPAVVAVVTMGTMGTMGMTRRPGLTDAAGAGLPSAAT